MRGSLSLVPPVAERGDSVDQEFTLEYLVTATTDVEAIATFLRHAGTKIAEDLNKSARARGVLVDEIKVRAVGVEVDLTEGVGISIRRVVTMSYVLSLETDHSYQMKAVLLFSEINYELAEKLYSGGYGSGKVSFSNESESDINLIARD